jgi:hypothetical protein
MQAAAAAANHGKGKLKLLASGTRVQGVPPKENPAWGGMGESTEHNCLQDGFNVVHTCSSDSRLLAGEHISGNIKLHTLYAS